MKVVFLDRDGVINEFPGNGNYVTKLKEFHFIPGSIEAIKALTDMGYSLFVISNQAGVAKGLYSKAKLEHITRNMLRDIRACGGRIKRVFYCTHLSEDGCDCRKPRIGSIRKALASMDKTIREASSAFFVGDTESDILAGHNAGCKTILVLSGREDRRHVRGWQIKPDFVAGNLLDAVGVIEKQGAGAERKKKSRKVRPGRAKQ